MREPYYSTPRAKMRPAINLNIDHDIDIMNCLPGFLRAVVAAVWRFARPERKYKKVFNFIVTIVRFASHTISLFTDAY